MIGTANLCAFANFVSAIMPASNLIAFDDPKFCRVILECQSAPITAHFPRPEFLIRFNLDHTNCFMSIHNRQQFSITTDSNLGNLVGQCGPDVQISGINEVCLPNRFVLNWRPGLEEVLINQNCFGSDECQGSTISRN